MAVYYVSSVAGNNSDGLSWANAKTTLVAGLALATVAGDIVYVDSAHTETQGTSISINSPTNNSYVAVISVNRNGSTTTGDSGRLAGASVTVTDFNAGIAIGGIESRSLYMYGVKCFATGNNGANVSVAAYGSTNGTTPASVILEECTLAPTGPGSNVTIVLGAAQGSFQNHSGITKLINCHYIVHNSSSGAAFMIRATHVEICGGDIAYGGANKPASLFSFDAQMGNIVKIMNMDLSGYEKSGGFYFDVSGLSGMVELVNCKTSSTPGLKTGAWCSNASSITMVNTDSGDTHSAFEFHTRLGSLTEIASIYADDGAKFDAAGIAWEVVTTASCGPQEPFICPWLMRWSDSVTTLTASLELVHDSATDLTDQNLWGEFEYLGSASFPLGTMGSTRNARPFEGNAVDYANSSLAWTGIGGFGNQNKQTVSLSINPAEHSLIRSRLIVGLASKTFYLDPSIRMTGLNGNQPTRWTPLGAFNTELVAPYSCPPVPTNWRDE